MHSLAFSFPSVISPLIHANTAHALPASSLYVRPTCVLCRASRAELPCASHVLPLTSQGRGDGWRGGSGSRGGRWSDREDNDGDRDRWPLRWGAAWTSTSLGARQGRQKQLQRRSTEPVANLTENFRAALGSLRVSHLLLGLNIAVFLLQGTMGGRLLLAGAKVNADIAAGQLHRLFTPMFLHASISHLAVNSFSLYSTGPSVESWFGRMRFISLYLVSGVCGNLMSFFLTPTPSVGASGAIFGLVGATAVLLARHRRILGPRSSKGLNSLAYIVLVNFGMGMSGGRIDNWGHLGGLAGGALFAYLAGPRLLPVRGPNGRTVLADVPLIKQAIVEAKLFSRRILKRTKHR